MGGSGMLVLQIAAGQLSASQAAEQYQMSSSTCTGCWPGIEPKVWPDWSPTREDRNRTRAMASESVRARIVELRLALSDAVLEAGPATSG